MAGPEPLLVSPDGRRLILIHRLARWGVAGAWIYHGLIPKLIFRDWSEMTLLHQMGVDIQFVPFLLTTIGLLEIGFGLLVLGGWKSRWPLWATIGAMLGSLPGLARYSPATLHAAFNPVSLNTLVILLAGIALVAMPEPKDQS